MVLGTVFAVIFAVAHLLGGGGGGGGAATQTAADLGKAKQTANGGPLGPRPVSGPSATATGTPPASALAVPDGPCSLDDITVTPVMGDVAAGSAISLVLQLSGVQPACNFKVSSHTLVAKVTHWGQTVWSSQQCTAAIPKQTVVVRSAQPTTVQVSWSGRRSDDTCSRSTSWAPPTSYRLIASVVGSEPGQTAFKLTMPPQAVVTTTVHPKPHKAKRQTPTATANAGR
ncbi:hypothetical protein EFL95_02280 [Nocardioides marmorisolisilvae]|uniref:Uncharacterized protein n=2 Tax=Nocardioides marmorisolisilvae TaxID=1542737 RepID=A0A3N0E036_9ACTN|nr:hypothetical protein EFL95_02280 [Nocardioides marmorisolisilvae]